MIKEYIILTAPIAEELTNEVNEYLENGYELYGPLNFQVDANNPEGFSKTYFAQAMIKNIKIPFVGEFQKGS